MFFFFQAEDGIRDLVRSRGLGDVYKRQKQNLDNVLYKIKEKLGNILEKSSVYVTEAWGLEDQPDFLNMALICLLYTSDAADERSSVDLGGRRIIKKKKNVEDR